MQARSVAGAGAASPAPTRPPAVPADELQRAVLMTVLYADLFDYPLTREELYRRLVGVPCDKGSYERSLSPLIGSYLSDTQGYVTWIGREHLVGVRRRRGKAAETLWATAIRYAGWLARVPFVRMVAVSGSLAVRNSEHKNDIDFFCITESNRLWLARLWIVPVSKLTRKLSRLFPIYLCPNYMLSLGALAVEARNLYTASEVTQAVPLWGSEAYRRFLEANVWVHDFLPHMPLQERQRGLDEPRRPWLTRSCERMLGGRLGDLLDRLAHRLFLAFYRKRARRRDWSWAQLAPAYRRNRYTVPEGGYLPIVRRLFLERLRERIGPEVGEAEVERLFALSSGGAAESCYDWQTRFHDEYDVNWRAPAPVSPGSGRPLESGLGRTRLPRQAGSESPT